MNKFLKVLFLFLGIPTKEKEKLNPGVLGFYDCKPYHNFKYALLYAKNNVVYDDGNVEIYTRVHKGTTFVNVLVNEEETFNPKEYDYTHLKELVISKGFEAPDKSIVFVAFQHINDNTIAYCKELCHSNKNNIIQGAVFNPKSVHMDYYKPVPDFYKLYDHFCEDLFYDFAFIDNERET